MRYAYSPPEPVSGTKSYAQKINIVMITLDAENDIVV